MENTNQSDSWIYDHLHKVYFHPLSNNYAIPDPITGQWSYIPSNEFHSASTSTSTSQHNIDNVIHRDEGGKEEGEIEDDMGWGGLMDPDKLAEIELTEKSKSKSRTTLPISNNQANLSDTREKHPAYVVPYDDPSLYAFPLGEDDSQPPSPKEQPNHILRLVVDKSECLEIGQVALIDTRENGVQIGRDRCEKGGQVRIRLKEMPVSKTHAVIYWGKGGLEGKDGKADGNEEEEEGWWIVDLGSTHGTFITSSTVDSFSKKTKWTRLSEPKHSSQPHSIHHQCQIKIGSTVFTTHIHPSWPCSECSVNGTNEIILDDGEPKSNVVITEEVEADNEPVNTSQIYAMDSTQKKQNRELKRKREMALLKESLMKKSSIQTSEDDGVEKREYLDRSAMRRKLYPSSSNSNSRNLTPDRMVESNRSTPPLPLTVSRNSIDQPIDGHLTFASSLLKNQGWTPGEGLGKKTNQGRSEPITTELRNAKKGLGAKDSKAIVDSGEGDWKSRGKQRRWEELSNKH